MPWVGKIYIQSVATAVATDLGHPYWINVYLPDPWHAPVAAPTVVGTPHDGRRKRPKHVE